MSGRGKHAKTFSQRLATRGAQDLRDASKQDGSGPPGAARSRSTEANAGDGGHDHHPSPDAAVAPSATLVSSSEPETAEEVQAESGVIADGQSGASGNNGGGGGGGSGSGALNAGASGIVSRLIASMWQGTSHTPAAVWNERGMNELLKEGRFDPLYSDLLHRLEHDRCIRAATWCQRMAIETADVPLLYLVVRNGCRYDVGTVPTERALRETLRVFVLLVLRVVQDTVALQRTQGSRAADDVFRVLVQVKLLPWLLNLRPADAWPKLSSILAEVEQLPIVKNSDSLPDHSWITAVSFTHLSTIRFGTPDADLRTACKGSSDAVLHRNSVRDHFFSIARAMHWRNFLSAGLGTFIPGDDSGGLDRGAAGSGAGARR